jgi:2'-hydroxyisoflavone reductase
MNVMKHPEPGTNYGVRGIAAAMNRRRFIAAASGAVAVAAADRLASAKETRPLRILILGGTQFVGVHMTECALQRGHVVTLFNRGRTHPELFPQLEKLQGDRDGQLGALEGRSWDAVIDDSGYVPRHVRLSAELLAANVRQYLYISSVSAYASFATPNNEGSALGKLADESVEKIDGDTYGPLKALCEKVVETALPGRATVLRPGYIVGPNDNTDRFTYWPARAARGGEMLAPGASADPIQFIDARDLARFAIIALERHVTGTFNVVAPPDQFSMGKLIAASVESANSLAHPLPPPRPTWVAAEFLESHYPQADIPIWVPSHGDEAAFAHTSAARSLKAGLSITAIRKTVSDTLAWQLARPEGERAHLKAGLTPELESEILAAWHAAAVKPPG